MTNPLTTLLILATLLGSANGAIAQSVRIQNGEGSWGYGWMFQHAGNCYAALPRHVASEFFPKVTISSAAPVVTDQAVVIRPFWEAIDLAIAVLDRGPLDARCTARLDDMRASDTTRGAASALLLRITPTGEEERLPITIVGSRTYLTFEGEVSRQGDAIGQGTSGAFAFVNGRPIGMAYVTTGTTGATFMRSEEIHMNLERFLAEQGSAFVAPQVQPSTEPAGSAVILRDAVASVPPVLPQFGPENLLGDGLFIATPRGPMELTFQTDGDGASSVSRIRLSAPTDGTYAIPKGISIYLDAGEAGNRFRFWTQGEMRPDGIFDTGPLAARNARWIRIVIRSAWGDNDLALDRVMID